MCGIAGFFGGDLSHDSEQSRATIARMVAAIEHRGPDANGYWHDANAGLTLGHARLSILDLSPSGAQPMRSASERFVISYNGEIYNHLDLREELASAGGQHDWRGHSDTKTLLAAIERWGIEQALRRTIGMFAFALWDRRDRVLTLARDRLGEKPLYYGLQGSGSQRTLLFGSELKALVAHPQFAAEIDRDALTEYMRFAYVPAPRSIYRGISKLPPGTYATLRESGADPEIRAYWSARDAVEAGHADLFGGSPGEAVDELERLLVDAIGKQMMSDVPLGAFLSGGVDSSAVVALMQSISQRPVKTFSIGFHEEGYNEADHAKAVAAHLGTDHTEAYVTAREARDVIPSLPAMYDEPFADASQIPTHLVSRLAREHVTVSLSGDAGDELFCGYDRYRLTDRVWRRIAPIPAPARRMAASAIGAVPPATWNGIARAGGRLVPPLARLPNQGHKMHKGARVLASKNASELYRGIVSHWTNPAELVVGGNEASADEWRRGKWLAGLSDVENMMAADIMTYLPDDILAKVDRAAMAVSLETRVPFLDHRVVELAFRLPLSLKLREGTTKWVLREVLYRHVPRGLIERPKMGFGLPIDHWLRGDLRDWGEELLAPDRLRDEGYLDPGLVRQLWNLHQSGQADVQYHLWDVLMFQAWLAYSRSAQVSVAHRDPPKVARPITLV